MYESILASDLYFPIYTAEKTARMIPARTILPAYTTWLGHVGDLGIGVLLRLYTSGHYSGIPGSYASR
jgi:hypothetical protein